jgi:hypothetical protein
MESIILIKALVNFLLAQCLSNGGARTPWGREAGPKFPRNCLFCFLPTKNRYIQRTEC